MRVNSKFLIFTFLSKKANLFNLNSILNNLILKFRNLFIKNLFQTSNFKFQIPAQQDGQIFIITLIILSIVLINTVLLLTGSINFMQNSSNSVDILQASNLAEAGIDKAVASINQTAGSYSGETETTLGQGTYEVSITNINATTKLIKSTGYIPSKAKPLAKKTATVQVAVGQGVAFNYAVQVGEGGLIMGNNATVTGNNPAVGGSVYSNGNIVMGNNASITGDAFVAGGVGASADQQNECAGTFCSDFVFGRTTSQLDPAQSFIPSVNTVLNKISLRLRKVGNPPNLTVRILADLGNPDRNRVLATSTLPSNLVTTEYGWTDVIFQSPPNLLINPYWIVLDTSADPNNYWMWSEDTNPLHYLGGQGKWSPNWNANNPTWNSINGDLDFRIYTGGVITSIIGSNNATIGHMNGFTRVGDAHANLISNVSVTRDIYYNQFANGVTVGGSSHPGSPDPPLAPMAISQATIDGWKQQAIDAGVHNIGYVSDCPGNLPAGRYIGFISMPNNCTLTIGSPFYISDGIWMSGNNTIKLNSSYGSASGVFITDGEITLQNNNRSQGSGTAGSYLMMLSDRDNTIDLRNSISINNNGNSGIFYAPRGIINVGNNNSLTEITAWQIVLNNNVTINYDQGLANTFFSSGPSGAYSVMKGTYQSK